MAERKGPEGERADNEPVESGQQKDRSDGADERDLVPAEGTADEGTELIDNHRESGSAEPERTGTAPDSAAESESASVLTFRRRADSADETETTELIDSDEVGEEPIDLAELQADDALLDALGGTNPDVSGHSGNEGERPGLEALLVAWRQDVDAAPIGELVDVDTAAAAIAAGRRPARRLKRWHLVPVATAAAVLMIGFTGVGLAARDALPGDMLWGVAQVLYTDHARAVQAATSARENLRNAEGALDQGNRSAAEAALRSAQEQMRSVDAEHGLSDLRAAHASLTARIERGESSERETPTQSSSDSGHPPSPTTQPLPPSSPQQPPPPPPTGTTTSSPSSTQEPPESSTSPSETSGSSTNPSSGWGSPLFPQHSSSSGGS
ncbi:anti-sigma-D factor RsdA [Saccharopolyspora rosea]|uniref:Anti-sigma-D factor RsdA n=1 Tax=Saccharopolyspora rosea TaxID=524884 RepID=A0ABW3FJF2_9PSEU|nr:anti-sigma-D factor RsdA [Saccharopolyspora rosea]